MIYADCFMCGKTIEEKSALLFTAPDKRNKCTKYHFCKSCWKLLSRFMNHIRYMRIKKEVKDAL